MSTNEFKRFFLLIKEYRAKIILILVLLLGNSLITILVPYSIKIIVDQYIPARNLTAIVAVCAVTMLIIIINYFIYRLRIRLLGGLSNELQYKIRNAVYLQFQNISYSKLSTITYGEFNTNLIQDVESLNGAVFDRIIPSSVQIIYLLATLVILLGFNLYLTLILYLTFSLFFVFILFLKNIMAKFFREYAAARSSLNATVNDILVGEKIIQAYAVTDQFISKLKNNNQEYIRKWLATNIFGPTIQSSIEIATMITYVLTFMLGMYWIRAGTLTAGELFLFLNYFPQLWQKFSGITDIFSGFTDASVYIKRLFSGFPLDDLSGETISTAKKDTITVEALSFDTVSFSFENAGGEKIFDRFSTSVHKPGLCGVIGRSGIGKSTMFDLLLGFYKPQEGRILINNTSLDDIDTKLLRKTIGIVHQEILLWNDTVMNNILFGDDTVSRESIIGLAKEIGFHKYIDSLENSYDCVVGTGGSNISAGQQRMVTLLRTLVRDPQILLFDEVTSNADSFTELLIDKLIKRLSKEKLCMLITHKKNEVSFADQVIELR
jgi:ABC-type multidrug transport system fused ATPase/permease subunit